MFWANALSVCFQQFLRWSWNIFINYGEGIFQQYQFKDIMKEKLDQSSFWLKKILQFW